MLKDKGHNYILSLSLILLKDVLLLRLYRYLHLLMRIKPHFYSNLEILMIDEWSHLELRFFLSSFRIVRMDATLLKGLLDNIDQLRKAPEKLGDGPLDLLSFQ